MAELKVSTYQAKAQLSKLLAACENGDDVIIMRGSKAVARLVAIEHPSRREFGFLDLHLTDEEIIESAAPIESAILPEWMRS